MASAIICRVPLPAVLLTACLVLAAAPTWSAATALVSQFSISPAHPYRTLPSGYFGYAYDWGESFAQTAQVDEWYPLLLNLKKQGSAGPLVFRLGAESADTMTAVPAQNFWDGISRLYTTVGPSFIFCLGLKQNNPALAVAVINKVYATIPKSAVIGFELGNEPLQWSGMPAGFWPTQYDALVKSNAAYIQSQLPGTPLIGMASHTTWLASSVVQPFITQQKAYNLMGMSAHVYAADPALASETSITLLNDDHVITPLAALPYPGEMLSTSTANGLWLRMDEVNAHWGDGKWGVDNTFAAALWTVDTYFMMATYGVSGVNCFTQPSNAFDVFSTNYGSAANGWTVTVQAAAAYYGHWMWQHTMDGPGTVSLLNITASKTTTNIKTYAVITSMGTVRAVVLNKNVNVSAAGTAQVILEVVGNYAAKTATLNFLTGASYTAETANGATQVLYNGRSADYRNGHYMYGPTPPPSTAVQVPGSYANGVTTYSLQLPPYSGVMLEIK